MTAHKFLSAMTEIDPALIADADTAVIRRRPLRLIAASAACLVLLCAAAIGFLAWGNLPLTPSSDTPVTDASALYEPRDLPLITSYPISLDASYASPRNGEVLIYIDLSCALAHYEEEDVLFWVRIDIHSEEPEEPVINFNEAKMDEELQRLAALGYDLYTFKKNWTGYWGEDKHYTTVCAKMTAEELTAFETVAADRYGYSFSFSRLNVADCTPICIK